MITDKHGDSELMLAADRGELSQVELCLETYTLAQINYCNPYGCSALYLAANHGHTDIVMLLLDANADPLLRNADNKAAASAAYQQDFSDICSLLPALTNEEKALLKPVTEG
jgi:ankyrin repeat protein